MRQVSPLPPLKATAEVLSGIAAWRMRRGSLGMTGGFLLLVAGKADQAHVLEVDGVASVLEADDMVEGGHARGIALLLGGCQALAKDHFLMTDWADAALGLETAEEVLVV